MSYKNPEDAKAYRKIYNQTSQYKKWHRKKSKQWRTDNPERSKEIYKRYYKNNKEKIRVRHNKYLREYTKRLRLQLINNYGGICTCCGESNVYFLTIDHVNGGGNKHRKTVNRSSKSSTDYLSSSLLVMTIKYSVSIVIWLESFQEVQKKYVLIG